jgi:hypothetical protein
MLNNYIDKLLCNTKKVDELCKKMRSEGRLLERQIMGKQSLIQLYSSI